MPADDQSYGPTHFNPPEPTLPVGWPKVKKNDKWTIIPLTDSLQVAPILTPEQHVRLELVKAHLAKGGQVPEPRILNSEADAIMTGAVQRHHQGLCSIILARGVEFTKPGNMPHERITVDLTYCVDDPRRPRAEEIPAGPFCPTCKNEGVIANPRMGLEPINCPVCQAMPPEPAPATGQINFTDWGTDVDPSMIDGYSVQKKTVRMGGIRPANAPATGEQTPSPTPNKFDGIFTIPGTFCGHCQNRKVVPKDSMFQTGDEVPCPICQGVHPLTPPHQTITIDQTTADKLVMGSAVEVTATTPHGKEARRDHTFTVGQWVMKKPTGRAMQVEEIWGNLIRCSWKIPHPGWQGPRGETVKIDDTFHALDLEANFPSQPAPEIAFDPLTE